ncbi:DUF721 domain-containing protein [Shumkonia mesophila]|uniref:DUF721 domain-containing protein n=1 Tax=Shumkonia mesophila TaxID=2838854 RepID=UPI002934D908|nr:DciA family protein [Shumkonia mesophila]
MATRTTDSAGTVPSTRRSGRVKALASAVEGVTRPIFGRRGLADGAIVHHWQAIVGERFSALTAPEKLVFPTGARHGGTLHLRVASGGIATQLQHLEPLLVERVNSYFGYQAVARLHFKQGPVTTPGESPAPVPPPLDAREEAGLAACLDVVEDPDLKAVLQSLGRAVVTRGRKRRSGG